MLNTSYTLNTAPVWTAPATGVYYFAFNDKSAAADTATMRLDTVTFSSTVLGVQHNTSAQFLVYPNPVHDVLSINTTSESAIKFVEIFDSSGRFVRKTTTETSQDSIFVGDLAKGIYFLRINTEKEIIVRKISKA